MGHTSFFRISIFVFTCYFLWPLQARPQDYTYTNYDVKDGLPSSTVYCTAQDKEGFLWFGTETGLSRFDGTHFKNFTTDDGLSDNEILKMFCDSKGRLWLMPFKKAICYIYKGVVHNKQNDSLLRKLNIKGLAWQICEDKQGNILIRETNALHLVKTNNTVTDIYSINNKPIEKCWGISRSLYGHFWVLINNYLYELQANGAFSVMHNNLFFVPLTGGVLVNPNLYVSGRYMHKEFNQLIVSFINRPGVLKFDEGPSIINYQLLADTFICFNRSSGCTIVNAYTGETFAGLLQGNAISGVFIDAENNYWFTTLGKGIYRLNSFECRSVKFLNQTCGEHLPVTYITKYNNSYIVGTGNAHLFGFTSNMAEQHNFFKIYPEEIQIADKVCAIIPFSKNGLLIGTDGRISKINVPEQTVPETLIIPVKSFFKIDDQQILVATSTNLVRFSPYSFRVLDTLLKERTTSVFYRSDTVFAGTLDGLIIKALKNGNEFKPAHPALQNRIAAIKEADDKTLWIATNGGGLVSFKNNMVTGVFTDKDGLNSNICRCLYFKNNTLWLGTDKGINRIDLSTKKPGITGITVTEGLASDMINTIFVDSGYVYAGTPEGISYFSAEKMNRQSTCRLAITDVIAGNDTMPYYATHIQLTHERSDFKIQYAGISYKSGGDIKYYYRLIGFRNDWQRTDNVFVNYTSLSYGHYIFQVKAVNKFGVVSNTVSIGVKVEKVFWEEIWFWVAAGLAVALIIYWIVIKGVARIKKKLKEKNDIRERIADLEQLALKSQMNPHFIFNSLNSIQYYVIKNDTEAAIEFIGNFSKLIRKTLDFSTKKRITVQAEIDYLNVYLKLEKERLENKFSFAITVDNSINPSAYFMPPLLLQPFVENAVRHGIGLLKHRGGEIKLHISKTVNSICFKITDNGVGIKAAQEFKTGNSIEYQSRGIGLINERVEIINRNAQQKIIVSIGDTYKPGTEINVFFPLVTEDAV